MLKAIQKLERRDALLIEAPAMLGSLVVAELFYKFHSFTLECICFLGTWFVLSSVLSLISTRLRGRPENGQRATS